MDEQIRQRFVKRVIRLAYYRRWLAAVGFGLTVLGWVAAADALVCQWIYNPATRTYVRICR